MPATAPSTPMLLSEHAKQSGSAAAMKFAKSIYTGGDSPLKHLKFVTDPALDRTVHQVTNDHLGTVNYGKLDEQMAETRSSSRKVRRSVYLTSNMISVDKRLLRAWNAGKLGGPQPVQKEFNSYAATMKNDIGYRFIVNNPITGEPDFEAGLWYQLQSANVASFDIHADMILDATSGADMSPTGGSAAKAMAVIEKIDELQYRMKLDDVGWDPIILMDPLTKRRMRFLLAVGGLFDQRTDQFNNTITTLNGIDIVETGVLASSATTGATATKIISTTETAAGTALTGSYYTSIYIVNRAALDCWQFNVMEPERLPDNGNFHEWALNWGMGYVPTSDRAYGRIFNIKVQE